MRASALFFASALAGCGPAGSVPLAKDDAARDTAADTARDTARDSGDSGADTARDTARDTADTARDTGEPPAPIPPPCTTWGEPVETGTVVDADLQEISGVAPSVQNPGVLWVHEDHGGEPEIYALDELGSSLGKVTLDGVENVDMEAMALAPCDEGQCLWIADTGDNRLERTEVALYRVPEPVVGAEGGLDATLTPTRFPIVYADGARNVEAFALTPDGRPVFFTKRGDGLSEVFVVDTLTPDVAATPRLVGTIATRPVEAEDGGWVTSADLWPDGTRALVRAYDRAWELDLGEAGIEAVATAPELGVPFLPVPHVEAVAYDVARRGYWQIPEAVNAGIAFTGCLD